MKVKLIALTLLTLMITPFTSCARDGDDPALKKLWAEYEKAVDADKPKDQCDILERIKKEAAQKHRAWDYYDASWKYVQARTSTNWKLRDELTAQANADIEQFGEPVAVYFNRQRSASFENLRSYVAEQKERLLQAHNPEFYSQDGNFTGFPFTSFLTDRLSNDYEYTLWSLFGRWRENAARDMIREYYAGRYPYDAFIEYALILRMPTSQAEPAMEQYVTDHAGQAVSLMARQYLLQRRQGKLNSDNGSSEQYRELARDCQTFLDDAKRFSGEEKEIAECCTVPQGILQTLTTHQLSLDVVRGKATMVVRNLPSVRLRILDNKKVIFDQEVKNPKNSFYVQDTLTLELPAIDDKDYVIKCTGDKVETESEYNRYTLSIAHKRDLDGYGVFVADYITGEPVERCDIILFDREGKEIDRVSDFRLDGFTYLPESMASKLDADRRWYCHLQAVARTGGLVRSSQRHYLAYERKQTISTDNPDRRQMILLTDRSAFNPDETVHYKALLYDGTYEYATAPAGIRLHATLTDPSGKTLAEEDLTTNEFGTAAGSFVLTKSDRGGAYRISVREEGGKRTSESTTVQVDEFVLPTFALTWTPDSRFYLPEDNITVQGNIRSYSGHNLATATATYSVETNSKTLAEGKLDLKPSGDFTLRFKGPENRIYNTSVIVTIRVTDATGETLEFTRTVTVSRYIPLNIRVDNSVSGRFEQPESYGGGSIVGEDVIRARFQLGGGSTPQTHPHLKIDYKVLREGQTILSGTAVNGETVGLDLTGRPSGLYEIQATASAVNDQGEEFTEEESFSVVKASDQDTALDLDVRSFFKEIADDGTGISLQVGTTMGPTWIVAELYGDGNRLLEKRIVKLAGVRGRPGSLQVLRFDRKPDYPETLTLHVFWFHDGRSFEYSVSSYKQREIFSLPLSFSRFLDTTSPHHDYSFTLRTAAGTEVAATIFDKSTETIRPNVWRSVAPARRSLPEVSYHSTNGVNSSRGFDTTVLSTRQSTRALGKNAAAGAAARPDMMVLEEAVALDRMVEPDEEAAITDDFGGDAAEEGLIRENFANTIAWEPFLRSDKDGLVTFNFTTADKLSTYYVQLFAHDKEFHNTTLRQEMVVTLPVKVAVVQPQYLYEGDRYVARVTVANSKGVPIPGRISVKFLRGSDYRTASTVSEQAKHVSVPAYGSADFNCEISAPALQDLGMLVSFTADDQSYGSDAVFVVMPVSPAVQTITEAHSALLLAGMDRDAVLADLRSQFVNVRGAEAALREISILGMIREAVPEKVLPQSENLLDQSEALYANFLIDNLPGGKLSGATPEQRADMEKKILACKNPDGGFGWFAGMSSSPVLTAVLLERLADMGDAAPAKLADAIPAAVKFLDSSFLGDRKRPIWVGGISFDQYLHVRAMYPAVPVTAKGAGIKEMHEFKKAVRSYLVPRKERGLNGQVFAKARRLKTLRALVEDEKGASLAKSWGIALFTASRLRKSLQKDVESLLQYAEPHRSGGTYYPNAVMPWRGLLESELYAHSLLCDLMTACGHSEVAEGIRLWIMVQKETQQWEDDPAYIQAIGSVLHGTEETLQTKVLALSATTTLPFPQIKASGNGFTLSCSYSRDGKPLQDGDELHVGDKILATYQIWNEENRSFVRLTAPRPAAFRPVQQVSGRYGWWLRPISITGWMSFSPQGYRSVLADRTEFWFDSYPEEKTSLSEEYFVTQEGTFQCPVPVIESLYAPHYRANDDGKPAVTVKP